MSQQRKSPSPPNLSRLEEDAFPSDLSTSRIVMSRPVDPVGYTVSDGCHVQTVRQPSPATTTASHSDSRRSPTALNDSNIKQRIIDTQQIVPIESQNYKKEDYFSSSFSSSSSSGCRVPSEEVHQLTIQDTISRMLGNRVQARPTSGQNLMQSQSPSLTSDTKSIQPKKKESFEVPSGVGLLQSGGFHMTLGRSPVSLSLPETSVAKQQQQQQKLVYSDVMMMRSEPNLQRHSNDHHHLLQRAAAAAAAAAEMEMTSRRHPAFDAMSEADEEGDTILHRAIISEHHDLIPKLIKLAAETECLDLKNKLQQTPLHLATVMQQPLVVRQLVTHGAKVKVFDRRGNTPLHIACEKGYYDCLVELTEIEENSNLSRMGRPSSAAAAAAATEELESALSSANYKGQTCLHVAASASGNQLNMIEHLVRNCGVDVNQKELSRGRTILHRAVEMKNYFFVQSILRFYSPSVCCPSLYLDEPMYDCFTALQIARMNDQTAIAHLLLSAGAEEISLPTLDVDINVY